MERGNGDILETKKHSGNGVGYFGKIGSLLLLLRALLPLRFSLALFWSNFCEEEGEAGDAGGQRVERRGACFRYMRLPKCPALRRIGNGFRSKS